MNPLRKQIQSMLTLHQREGGFGATLNVEGRLSILPDHFAEQPILPGICMVQAVLLAGAESVGLEELCVRELKTLKLMRPVLPGNTVCIDASMTPREGEEFAIKAKLTTDGQRCAEVSMVAAGRKS
jgi:3-hydroxymyristoyl/3-hydroxydecanoyl-(acyl carrier protein) dehydratase